MKNIVFLLALMTCALLSACSNFLDEQNPNKIPTSSYFQTENDVLRALNGAYLALRDGDCLGEGSTANNEQRSDNIGTQDNQSSNGDPFQYTNFSLIPTNAYLYNHWRDMFITVSRCNFILTYVDDVSFANEDVRKMYKAEAKYMRALVYSHLVRKWGDVPLVTVELSSPAEATEKTYREKKETVYAQIVKDLTEALDAGSLPNIQPASGKGRACKAAINALLGEVYLTMATTLDDGNKQSYFQSAKKYLLDAYNMRSFGELKEIPYEDVFDVEKKNICPEIIFQIVYIQGDQNYSSSKARGNQPKDDFVCSQYKSTGTGEYVTLDLVKEYEDGDLRKDWSVHYSEFAHGYYPTKFRDVSDKAGTLGYGGNDWIISRYADVILLLAEASMYLNENDAAIGYLNQVRERAGLPKYEEMQNNSDYKAKYPSLKLAILHERRSELAFENHRWFDLLRCYTPSELESFFHAKDQNDFGLPNMSNFGPKDIYYPIPFNEWKLNPDGMYQNPGY